MARGFKVGAKVAKKNYPSYSGEVVDVMSDGGGVEDDDGNPCSTAYEVQWPDGSELVCGKYLIRFVT